MWMPKRAYYFLFVVCMGMLCFFVFTWGGPGEPDQPTRESGWRDEPARKNLGYAFSALSGFGSVFSGYKILFYTVNGWNDDTESKDHINRPEEFKKIREVEAIWFAFLLLASIVVVMVGMELGGLGHGFTLRNVGLSVMGVLTIYLLARPCISTQTAKPFRYVPPQPQNLMEQPGQHPCIVLDRGSQDDTMEFESYSTDDTSRTSCTVSTFADYAGEQPHDRSMTDTIERKEGEERHRSDYFPRVEIGNSLKLRSLAGKLPPAETPGWQSRRTPGSPTQQGEILQGQSALARAKLIRRRVLERLAQTQRER